MTIATRSRLFLLGRLFQRRRFFRRHVVRKRNPVVAVCLCPWKTREHSLHLPRVAHVPPHEEPPLLHPRRRPLPRRPRRAQPTRPGEPANHHGHHGHHGRACPAERPTNLPPQPSAPGRKPHFSHAAQHTRPPGAVKSSGTAPRPGGENVAPAFGVRGACSRLTRTPPARGWHGPIGWRVWCRRCAPAALPPTETGCRSRRPCRWLP